ncbi:Fic family protein [Pseudodesulfovibrio indicus]|uniref:Cell filamentation protein Fic n=1 Tax=Pseudodesulfovibrio indicus TaxID=1716143 RepID=A0A126QSB1_9BACT|nr:Fic family protein [Pseudodesulfovibrio indicus]AMK12963.1 cell filamentation protein Fic [Pseudodesulfovibrio indicus]TDT92238.1 Fic/DOC family protein [Pseudodesulfovibrio indicus]
MKQDKNKALFIAQKVFAELVFDVQSLEGMPFTMPEVQTYLQGVTVGGHKVSDVEKLKQQKLGWELLIEMVKEDTFTLTKETACAIQKVIGHGEALDPGAFRTGQVGIAGTEYKPPRADELDDIFAATIEDILELEDIREQAYRLHLDFARNQFFYDGNKLTGLLMLNGHLMSSGYPPLSVSAKRLTEYNAGMIKFYESGDHSGMMTFLKQCHEDMYKRFE